MNETRAVPYLAPEPGGVRWRTVGRRRSLSPAAQGTAALVVYGLFSVLLFALPVLSRFSSAYVGSGKADQQLYLWSLAWWPHALGEGRNPLVTDQIWAPEGIALGWVTSVPGPSLVAAPVTLTAGPVASLNLLMVSAPALAGWGAFLVARRLTGAFWPSLVGGYLFGFSTYQVVQTRGHLNLAQTVMVPLALYLVIRLVRGEVGRIPFLLSLAAVLVAQASISTEILATMTLFGGIAVGGTALWGPEAIRGPVRAAVTWIGGAYLVAGILLSPLLFYVLTDIPGRPIRDPIQGSVDLLGFVLPRKHTLIGGDLLEPLTRPFVLLAAGDGSYLGIPLLAVSLHFAVANRRRRGWLLPAFMGVTALLAMGPVLQADGKPTVPLPWRLATEVPIIQNAAPGRFVLFLWLAASVVVAIWLAGRPRSWIRWTVVALGAIAILPDPRLPHPDVQIPAFFSSGLYRTHLEPGEIVLPITRKGTEMGWQVAGDMGFRIVTGHVGVIPPASRGPVVHIVRRNLPQVLQPGMIEDFLDRHDVGAIVVDRAFADAWEEPLAGLGVVPVEVGGVVLYDLSNAGGAEAAAPPS
jgi:hypothetical protein